MNRGDCKYMYSNETMDELYICVNGKSENFGEYTAYLEMKRYMERMK